MRQGLPLLRRGLSVTRASRCLSAVTLAAAMLLSACTKRATSGALQTAAQESLVGAWQSEIRFKDGAFASIQDLEFMYVFNEGGTMTESSNYDGAPPVPPAYGVWRRIGPREFEAKYVFYATKAPANLETIPEGGGWLPAGHGVFLERIVLSEDGKSYGSTIRYDAYDAMGERIAGGGEADGRGRRMGF